ncbi:hypothetical protein HZS_466 [Henneguya salminicola]|nr:hypothetical protein HZS_466 [Henneguya salminicola]
MQNIMVTIILSLWIFLCSSVYFSMPKVIGEKIFYKNIPFLKDSLPVEIINLDLSPKERWIIVSLKYKEHVVKIKNWLKDTLGVFIYETLAVSTSLLTWRLPIEYVREIKGIAKALDLSTNEVILLNIFYEYFTTGSSIIASNRMGDMLHAGNINIMLFLGKDKNSSNLILTQLLRNITTEVHFFQNGKLIVQSFVFVGQIGIFTGISSNNFSIIANKRFITGGGYIGFIKYILNMGNPKFISFITREILTTAKNYDVAKAILQTQELIAPAYFTLASNEGNGCVITRDRTKTEFVSDINPSHNMWYLLQTNSDINSTFLYQNKRRSVGNLHMKKLVRTVYILSMINSEDFGPIFV